MALGATARVPSYQTEPLEAAHGDEASGPCTPAPFSVPATLAGSRVTRAASLRSSLSGPAAAAGAAPASSAASPRGDGQSCGHGAGNASAAAR